MDCRKERVGTGIPERKLLKLSKKKVMTAQTRMAKAERTGEIWEILWK